MASHNYKAPPVKHRWMTLERINKYISQTYFSDVNLQSKLLARKINATELTHFKADGRFEFGRAKDAEFKPFKLGDLIGPLWSTHWFRVRFKLPENFLTELTEDEELLFCWNSGTEATIWDEGQGQPIGAFSCGTGHGDVRKYYPIAKVLTSDCIDFLIEVACNKVCGDGVGSFIAPPDCNATYSLAECSLVVRNRKVYSLIRDLRILCDIAEQMEDGERGFVALYTANEMLNIIQAESPGCHEKALEVSDKYFSEGNGVGQHVIHTVGHCHMDCAWLWPYEETKRKCSRSWSATLELMDRYPDWKFVCSSAQQYEWVQTHYPDLFLRIKEYVKSGRFIPVGGSWVEMDGYLPSGESMCRQLLLGQRYFLQEFGVKCTEFWLPDTFGYSAQLPQIVNHFGMNRFFTQKISWNLFNKFPHHTFYWKGLDGTSVLSHFAPGDSYHMQANVSELTKTIKNCKDKGRSGRSLFLFGHGDGGQGPTEDMLENLERLRDVDGLPRVQFSDPSTFFQGIEDKESQNLCTWSGELYLEMHNGTYTTQSKIKWYNRRCEFLLHDVEFLATLCYIGANRSYPFQELDSLWKKVLLNQFHDVLPGSSIEIVNDDAKELYKQVMDSGNSLLEELIHNLSAPDGDKALTVYNTMSWPRQELIAVEADLCEGLVVEQGDIEGKAYQLVTIDGLGTSSKTTEYSPVKLERRTMDNTEEVIVLSNSKICAEIDHMGRVCVLRARSAQSGECEGVHGRNLLSGPANQFTLYNDIPLFWDAWDVMDFHQETRKELTDVVSAVSVLEEGPLRASVELTIRISDMGHIKQTISLDAESSYLRVDCRVKWQENRTFLKVEFPLDIVSDYVTYESQFGHIRRPTHRNTSWDSAKFEVCSQKWMDLSDYSGGVAILNDSKYGCSVMNNSTLSLSLLRSPKSPDANADMGVHEFSYAMMPHHGSFQASGVIQAAYNLNSPLIIVSRPPVSLQQPLFVSDQPSVVIETVKVAECDRAIGDVQSRNIILRCYESYGGACQTTIGTGLPLKSAALCDGLENELETLPLNAISSFTANFAPYQLRTVKVTL